MKAYSIALGSILTAAALPLAAQQPSLGSIEAPYPAIQSTVHVAGGTYTPGAVAYGQVGAPLALTGSNFGMTGTVQFLGYMNGVADGKNATATVTLWTPTLLILSVPSTAVTGLVKVTTSGGTSNGLPFIVMPGSYAPSCPVAPDDSDFQIVTSSLQDGTVSQIYSVALSATGGLPPYTWSSVGNALPSGLSLSPAGVITGTPTTATANPVSLTIQALDSNHLITQALLNLKIDSTFQATGPVYSYSATYDGVGNVNSYTDSVMGAWSFQYDTLNRLATGNATTGDYDGQYACWNYDSFGNRQQQVLSSAAFVSGGGNSACQAPATASVATDLATYTSSNQIAGTNAPGIAVVPTYDAAGNITSDGLRNYLYDAEGRVCALSYTPIGGITVYYGYEYDAEGNRVAKGTITTMSCDPSASGLSYTESYVLSPSGQQLTMLDGNGHWQRTNVYAGGLLATYDTTNLHFHLTDPLGTRRVQTSATGFAETDCESLPFGDEMTCFPDPNAPSSADDSTPLHFTGKVRDTETGGLDGNDYFKARYYGSAMGRFQSPDPEDAGAVSEYPQTWNGYSYVQNNPLTLVDPDGLRCTVFIFGINTPTGKENSDATPPEASAYPYPRGGIPLGVLDVFGQSLIGTPVAENSSAADLIAANQNEPGGIDVVAHSGGAQTFATGVWDGTISTSNIASLTYLSPGTCCFGPGLDVGVSDTEYYRGTGLKDFAVTLFARLGGHVQATGAKGHNFKNILASDKVQNRLQTFRDRGSRGPCTKAPAPNVTPITPNIIIEDEDDSSVTASETVSWPPL